MALGYRIVEGELLGNRIVEGARPSQLRAGAKLLAQRLLRLQRLYPQ